MAVDHPGCVEEVEIFPHAAVQEDRPSYDAVESSCK
jgi:hypothetical protein